jgi:hypothetical protein
LIQLEDTRDSHPVTGSHLAGEVVFDVDIDVPRRFTAAKTLGRFLYTYLLGVYKLRLIDVYPERSLSLAPGAFVWILQFTFSLRDSGDRAASLALKRRLSNFRPYVGSLANDARDGDQGVDIGGPDLTDVSGVAQSANADVGAAEFHVDG